MNLENMGFEKDADGIVTVTWDMPGRSMNVLSVSSMTDFQKVIDTIRTDDSIKGAVITSGKPAFLAGADLSELGSGSGMDTNKSGEEKLRDQFEQSFKLNQMLRGLETCGKPIAAAVNGTALGGGLEIVLACHHRVVADDQSIQLGLPESKVGLLPGAGGTQRLPRLIGIAQAMPLMLQGTSVRPQKALEMGIVQEVAPREQIMEKAKAWIRGGGEAVQPWDRKGFRIPGGHAYDDKQTFMIGNALVRKTTYANYPAQLNILKAVYEGTMVPIDAALRIETRYFVELRNRPEARNMIRSLFLSMQELGKLARRPRDVPQYDVKKLGVLGAGLMGAGIAHVSASAGIEVVLIDRDQAAADKGKAYSERLVKKQMDRGRMTQDKADEILARITPTTDYDKLKGADLIIEAVFEDRDIKADVTKRAEAQLAETAVFGSNTSTLPITSLATASERPESFIGIHFFSPVERMPLVEIIMGEKTDQVALARTMDYVRKIRKTPIVVNDSRGFYTSRVVGTYIGEGLAMLAEGVTPALVENAGRMSGMPVGPLVLNDEVGIDLSYKIRKQTKKDQGAEYKATPVDFIIDDMVEKHERHGRKNGKGFYDYSDAGKSLWPGLRDLCPPRDEQPDVEVLKQRFMVIQALETARCFEEGVLTDVRDGDVGAILGWGFAPFTGGPLSYIDTMGTKKFVKLCEKFADMPNGERFKPSKLLKEMAEKDETFYERFNPHA